ncbi:DUF669 domain-containing protein [Faecalibacterium prausnitzii]|jgi:hypothetical protein|uniref:DUF669 domain-containing protein n=1 Tax=Faecalibacterium prausnitzii TaxID=853 RepID=UPI003C2FB3A4
MAVDFSAFDAKMDPNLQDDVKNAKEYEDVPNGDYIVSVDKMEVKTTKAGDKLMFAVQMSIKENSDGSKSNQKGRKIFFNRVISGNRVSESWNDGKAIKSVITWLDKLGTDLIPEFVNYSDFAELVLDIFQEIQGKVELDVTYKASDFNPVSINEVYDI